MRTLDASLDLLDEAASSALGIGRSDLRAMEIISRAGTASPSQISAELRLTTGSVTALLDRLTRAGLVHRGSDAEDRRRVTVELTTKGRSRERHLFEPLGRAVTLALARYTPAELTLIADFLAKVTAITDAHRERIQRRSPHEPMPRRS